MRKAILSMMIMLVLQSVCFSQDGMLPGVRVLDSLADQQYRLYRENKSRQNYSEAFTNLQNYALISDSVIRMKRNAQLEQLNRQYENDKKSQELDLLVKENKSKEIRITRNRFFIYGITGLFVLISLIVLLLIRQGRIKAEQKALTLEQTLLRAQMNPHFIFNTLTNIQSFILRNEPEKATGYLDSFSGLISSILENSGRKEITLKTEIDMLTDYFRLQQLRYGDKLNYIFKVDSIPDPDKLLIPPMMIQPLVENAIEHGIKPRESKGRVEVRFQRIGSELQIEVEDDGVGRNCKKEEKGGSLSSHAGLALVILKERLESLKTGRFEIQDLLDANGNGCGTISRLRLPLKAIDS